MTETSSIIQDLSRMGIIRPGRLYMNLAVPRLVEEAVARQEGILTARGALVAKTGKRTGRSPGDKFMVEYEDRPSAEQIAWGKVNQPIAPKTFERLLARRAGQHVVLRRRFRGEQEQGRAVPLITIAPFAVIAPLIGPALDRLQHGRRVALAASFALRTALAVVLIANYDGATGSFPSWVLYPCALGMMVLSKSFSVLRSAVTPRVLPPTIDLVRVNSRLTVFGLLGGTIVGGAVAAGVGVPVQPVPHARCAVRRRRRHGGRRGAVDADSEMGGGHRGRGAHHVELPRRQRASCAAPASADDPDTARQPLGRNIITALWGNCTIKVMVGFLFLYPAFVAKSHDASGWEQLRILGLIGAAAAIGNFAGNFTSARLQLGHPAQLVVRCTIAVTAVALATAVTGNLFVAAFATLVTSGASAIAKASLDASLQDDLPEESRASAFGRSESLLQLAWVAGGATGVLIYTDLWVGFTAITAVLILGLAQTLVSYNGDSLIPGFGGNRPVLAEQEGGCRIPRRWRRE